MKMKLYTSQDGKTEQYWFNCPGCKNSHAFTVNSPTSPCWDFNGDVEKPTFRPSLLVNGFDPKTRCHSFVTDGKIQFLNDCYHELKDQTVDIPEYE